jgi:hypothetical protein
VISLLLAIFLTPFAEANINEIFAEALSGRPDRGGIKTSYEIRQYETKEIKHSSEMYGIRQHRVELLIPLQQLTDKKWKLHLSGFHQEIRSNFLFPNRRVMPNSLWNVGAGVTHSRLTDRNHTVGGGIFVGSNSDKPFSNGRDLVAQANFLYKVPTEGENAWLFFVSFSNDRGFLNYAPLPGAAYFFRAHEKLRLAIGVPFFFLFWTPFEKAIFNVSYLPLYNGQAKFSYYLFGPAHLYLQTKHQGDLNRLSDRANSKERFIQEELQSSLGFVMPLEKSVMMEANVGFSWDRKVFLGESSQDRKLGQIARPEKSPFATLKLMANF